MPFTLALPDNYEFVALAGVASTFLTNWQGFVVGRARKAAGIKYPQMYAEKSEMAANKNATTFNNVQRAHQNTLETYPQFLMSMFLTGLKFPTFAAAAGGLWVIGKFFYTTGYRKGPEHRMDGLAKLGSLSYLTLWVSSIVTASMLVYERVAK